MYLGNLFMREIDRNLIHTYKKYWCQARKITWRLSHLLGMQLTMVQSLALCTLSIDLLKWLDVGPIPSPAL